MHPPFLCPLGVLHVCGPHLCLYFGFANRFIKALLVCLSVVTRVLAARGQGLLVPHYYTLGTQQAFRYILLSE